MSSPPSYPEQISIGEYILARLAQLGVTYLFGVPGDFNLAFLDLVEDHEDIEWVGNANELNAAYAVDGYARVKRGVGAVLTTFGVGELSALNGIAGCYSERIPVLHIVGVPSTILQKEKALLHHTLGTGDFHAFEKMSQQITCKTSFLDDAETAAKMIDDTLIAMLEECRPAYLTLPTNLVSPLISSDRLKKALPPTLSAPHPLLQSTESLPKTPQSPAQEAALDAILSAYRAAKNPVILVDALAERLGVEKLVQLLAEITGMMVFASPMGKSCVDENLPLYGGVYAGDVTVPSVADLVNSADLVLDIGPLKSDFNTGSFSYGIKTKDSVELHSDRTVVGYAVFPDCGLRTMMPLLIESLRSFVTKEGRRELSASVKAAHEHAKEQLRLANVVPEHKGEVEDPPTKLEGDSGAASARKDERGLSNTPKDAKPITHAYLWPRVSNLFAEGDVILAETGTSSFGILDSTLPANASLILQVLWGSIGWSVGATLGAALAAREQKRRTILFVGEGSLQLTVQEIGSMIHHGLKPILFVINNDGYEIERQIHGPKRKYNNVPRWNYQTLLSTLSPAADANEYPPNALAVDVTALGKHKSYRVANQAELDTLLNDHRFEQADHIQLVEIVMPRDDAPRALLKQAKLSAKANEGS